MLSYVKFSGRSQMGQTSMANLGDCLLMTAWLCLENGRIITDHCFRHLVHAFDAHGLKLNMVKTMVMSTQEMLNRVLLHFCDPIQLRSSPSKVSPRVRDILYTDIRSKAYCMLEKTL